ncbi:MAG: chromosome segregation protein SMC [Dactylosporangium sp.]|nr:chromosome segregation protein SMC [Dactylosporangium sp.]NNJ63582.1 chromosome segregation protein SMC [Dactylosporangium sp.]
MSRVRTTSPSTASATISQLPVGPGAGAGLRRKLPVSASALPQRAPGELLLLARSGLAEAAEIRADGMRYATAHLAALRAAAAMLAARAIPAPPGHRGRVTSAWSLLVLVAPDLGDWAAFFAAGASRRAAAEAGIPQVVTRREADDLLRAVEQFIGVVSVALGLSYQPMLEDLAS